MIALALVPLLFSPRARAQAGPVAGAAVTSKEWKVTRSPERVEEFSGDVRYKSGPNAIAADWALYRHKEDLWNARGHVRVERDLDSGDVFKAAADRAVWDRKNGWGRLTADQGVDFSRTPAGGEPDFGRSGKVEWRGEDQVLLEDGMHVWGPRMQAWADLGVYARGAQRLDLSGGRPVLLKYPGWEGEKAGADWRGAVKADAISAYQADRVVTADGRAVGWIEFPKKQSEGKGAR